MPEGKGAGLSKLLWGGRAPVSWPVGPHPLDRTCFKHFLGCCMRGPALMFSWLSNVPIRNARLRLEFPWDFDVIQGKTRPISKNRQQEQFAQTFSARVFCFFKGNGGQLVRTVPKLFVQTMLLFGWFFGGWVFPS